VSNEQQDGARRAHEQAAGDAWQAMYRLVFEGEGQQRFHEACDAIGLTPGVLKTLLVLRSDHPTPMRELSDRFHCDPSYVTSLVDGLEAAGMAERRTHPTDRRVKMVALSRHGEAAQAQVRKVLGEPPASLSALGTDELHHLAALLAKVAGAGPPSA